MKRTLLALLALAVAACTPTATAPPADAQDQVAELWTEQTRTRLVADAAYDLTRQCSRASPGPVEELWVPSRADVDAMEDQLIHRLARELEAAGESVSPGSYYRQYAGFVIGERRVIYVNGVHESAVLLQPPPPPPFNWRTHAIRICDGGSITFGVEYDTETRTLRNFAFNGRL